MMEERRLRVFEMRRACNAYEGEERCIQGFGEETPGKETTWKTQA
jgi:hypothetical protein